MNYLYIFDEQHNIVRLEDKNLRRWSEWYGTTDRHVGDTQLQSVRISTVFLGRDHNWSQDGPPILFETIIFADNEHELDGLQWRYVTWVEAEQGHAAAVRLVEESLRII